jgi:hypothetical protein
MTAIAARIAMMAIVSVRFFHFSIVSYHSKTIAR